MWIVSSFRTVILIFAIGAICGFGLGVSATRNSPEPVNCHRVQM